MANEAANEKVAEGQGGQAAAPEASAVPKELADEIEGAVGDVVASIEKDRAERIAKENARQAGGQKPQEDPPEKPSDKPKQDLPSGETRSGEKPEGDTPPNGDKGKDGEGDKPEPIPDALVERAIKAGMPYADVRSFKKQDALERVIGVLEKKHGAEGGDAAGGEKKGGDGEADLVADIPDLDPDKYDEEVVKGFKAMKDIIRRQQQMLAGQQSEGKARDAAWFDSQVAALGKDYVEAVGVGDRSKLVVGSPQSAKFAELESKFNVLAAGYKAAGKDVGRETVFKEAVAVVLGDVAAKVEATLKSEELERRKKMHVNRPSGNRATDKPDAFSEAAEVLDRKFFGKK
jgi:hypothetical protein